MNSVLSETARQARARALKEAQFYTKRINKALKLAKRLRGLEQALADDKGNGLGGYEDAYISGYERHMPLRDGNEAYSTARRRMFMSDEELMLLIGHPEMFPNPRLVYSYFSNRYRIDWDL